MRRAVLLFSLVGLAVANTGCLMVISDTEVPCRRHVVEINDELYIVDEKTKRAEKINVKIAEGTEEKVEGKAHAGEDAP